MPSQKRTASETIENPRRSSRRISTQSRYFEGSDESDTEPPKKRGRPRKQVQKEDSDDYEDDLVKEPQDYDQEEEEEEEEEDKEEDDEDQPPKVTIIPFVKMRDDGGVEYGDDKIHHNTLLFLKDLKANNRRPWLKTNDEEYRRAVKDWQSFIERTTESVIEADETIPELPTKDVIFRIHRDIRFSKDPTPYKPHFSAAWSRTGRKGPYACYYIHCEPKKSFIGGGLWCPDGGQMQKLRASIDERPARWRRALNDEHFKRIFLPDVPAGAEPEEALRAFAAKNQNNALKTKPKGFNVDHRDIQLLKLRNFTISTKVDDNLFCKDDTQEKISDIVRPMVGFITFLNSIVMPDPDQDDSEDEDEEPDNDDDEEDGEDEEDEE